MGYGENEITPEAVDLIKNLLKINPNERLKLEEIKSHPFFNGSF